MNDPRPTADASDPTSRGASSTGSPRATFRRHLHRWLPITSWAGGYQRRWLRPDTIAALTVIGLLVPSSMAYAQIAGVPPEAGLYAALAGLLVYGLFGTSRQLACSPTSTAAIMTAAVVAAHGAAGPEQAIALVATVAVLVGLVSLTAGVARLGFISEFLARPVISGYVTGLALTIIAGQVPRLLGVPASASADFLHIVWHDLTHLAETSLVTAAMSTLALVLLFGLRRRPRLPGALIVLVLGVAAAALFDLEALGVAMVGAIPGGLPTVDLPSLRDVDLLALLPSAAGIAIMVYAEALSGARTFSVQHSYRIDADQELVALGLANIGSGALGGVVVSGGLSGSALNESSGARTQLAGLIGAAVMVVVLLVATHVGNDLPQAILGAIVVRAVWGLIDVQALRRFAVIRSVDVLPALAALIGVLVLGVLPGLGIAVGLSLAILIYRASRPHAAALGRVPNERTYSDMARHPENETLPGLLIYRLDGQLFFANAGFAIDRLNELLSATQPPPRVVIWNLESTTDVDVTAAEALVRLVHDLRDSGRDLVFARAGSAALDVFERSGLLDLLGEDHLFLTVDGAVRSCLHGRLAVIAALEGQLAEATAACRLAGAVVRGETDSAEARRLVAEIEHRGDTMRSTLVRRLAGVLVAPIDREDLYRLSRSIDDVLDNLRDFVRQWDLYGFEKKSAFAELLDAAARAIGDLELAVQAVAKDPKDMNSALAAKKGANQIRRLYDLELGRLFRGELTMEVVKRRELLRRLDVVGLRLNEAADRLSDAVVKRWA
jgi:high affinity sulfate transporter 1